jgi:hypothetical protein
MVKSNVILFSYKQQAIPSINQYIVYLFVHDKILPCKTKEKKIRSGW